MLGEGKFPKTGEISAYLFTDGNDSIQSKKMSHSQKDSPRFASAPVIQGRHIKYISMVASGRKGVQGGEWSGQGCERKQEEGLAQTSVPGLRDVIKSALVTRREKRGVGEGSSPMSLTSCSKTTSKSAPPTDM